VAERDELDRRSDELALAILEPLDTGQRSALVAAMSEVEQLVRASMVTFSVEDAASTDARWCIDQYFAELNTRFESGFNPDLSISADAQELTPPAGLLVIARLRHEPVGCGALKFHEDRPTELKRMWVSSAVRGLGVGRRLLQVLERHAREAGASVVHLETNRALTEAISLYRRSGYREVAAFNDEPYAHHWFQKRLT
jgi:GNAT superfamily N-acetyltransferase